VPCHRINKLGTRAHHPDRSAAAATFANGIYFLYNPRTFKACCKKITSIYLVGISFENMQAQGPSSGRHRPRRLTVHWRNTSGDLLGHFQEKQRDSDVSSVHTVSSIRH